MFEGNLLKILCSVSSLNIGLPTGAETRVGNEHQAVPGSNAAQPSVATPAADNAGTELAPVDGSAQTAQTYAALQQSQHVFLFVEKAACDAAKMAQLHVGLGLVLLEPFEVVCVAGSDFPVVIAYVVVPEA